MSGQTFLFLLAITLVVAWLIIRALWRAWATSRVRHAARKAAPAVEHLEAAISAFHARFPVPAVTRLPMDPEDYPVPKPRMPSAPRPRTRTSRRRSNYRRRYR